MPLKIPQNIPAFEILKKKNVFVISKERAETQDIRPLKIGIFNLMPSKEITETQIFRMIANSPLQIEIVLIKTKSYQPKNVYQKHLDDFYLNFEEAIKTGLDGLIITGAPVELINFEEVKYWQELTQIMKWSKKYVSSTLHICWGAQAGLYFHYGIKKYTLKEKKLGIFLHKHAGENEILRGLDDEFFVPHSRYTEVKKKDIKKEKDLEILAESKEAGVYLVANKSKSLIFITGHPEYDRNTLAEEYKRDLKKGIKTKIPYNYFPDNDITKTPKLLWRANAETFYRNWINFVYQTTPYKLKTGKL